MTSAVLTSKGQLTIPADVRRRLGLRSGDRVEFVEIAKGRFAIEPATGDVRALKGILKMPGKPVTIEDMNEIVLERAVERNRS